MNLFFIDHHKVYSTSNQPGLFPEMARQTRILVVFQMPWLHRDAKAETPQEIAPNFWVVYRRVAAPYRAVLQFDSLADLDKMLFERQLKRYIKQLGWGPDIIEFSSPHFRKHSMCNTGAKKTFRLSDHFSRVPGIPAYQTGFIARSEKELPRNVDLSIATASELVNLFSDNAKAIRFLPNAGDKTHYQPLWMRPTPEPEALKKLPRPIFGYTGNLNLNTDWKNLIELAKLNPQYTFVLLGNLDGPPDFYQNGYFSGTMRLPNVHYLGKVAQEELPTYCAHFDVALILDEINEFSKTRNQNKIYQYLLTGLPITGPKAQPDYSAFSELLFLFDDPKDWSRQCELALNARDEESSRRRRAYAERIDLSVMVNFRVKMYEALLKGEPIPYFTYPHV